MYIVFYNVSNSIIIILKFCVGKLQLYLDCTVHSSLQ